MALRVSAHAKWHQLRLPLAVLLRRRASACLFASLFGLAALRLGPWHSAVEGVPAFHCCSKASDSSTWPSPRHPRPQPCRASPPRKWRRRHCTAGSSTLPALHPRRQSISRAVPGWGCGRRAGGGRAQSCTCFLGHCAPAPSPCSWMDLAKAPSSWRAALSHLILLAARGPRHAEVTGLCPALPGSAGLATQPREQAPLLCAPRVQGICAGSGHAAAGGRRQPEWRVRTGAEIPGPAAVPLLGRGGVPQPRCGVCRGAAR